MKQQLLLFLAFVISIPMSDAQLLTTLPQQSPKAKVMQTVGLTDIAVVYHRPSVNEREIWGGLVPYGQVWRAGANENTVFYTSDDIEIEGNTLKAGKYGLHVIPEQDNWTLIFSNAHSSWGSYSYDPAEDALRVKVKPQKSDRFVEQLTFAFTSVGLESAICELQWENVSVPFQVKASTHEVVLTNLRNELRDIQGFSWISWNEAANYCLQNNVNLDEASKWTQRSIFMQPTTQNLITHARIEAARSDKEDKNAVMLATLEKDLGAHPVTWREYQSLSKFASQQLGNQEQALAWASRAVEMSPNMSTMMTKADILESMDKGKKAEAVREEATALGSNAELNAYGYKLAQQGKTGEAVKVFLANAEKNPEDPNVWDSLGEGYYMNGQKDEAVKALKKSLSMDPPANVKANSLRLLQAMGVNYHTGT